jgi:hypothetical protein
MIGDGLPEIINFCRFASGSDVVVNFADQSATLFIFDQRLNGSAPDGELGLRSRSSPERGLLQSSQVFPRSGELRLRNPELNQA